MIPVGVALAIGGFVFLMGALTARVAFRSYIPEDAGGPPLAVLVGAYGLMIAGAIVLGVGGIPQ